MRDFLFGGLLKPTLATGEIDINNKVPWHPDFVDKCALTDPIDEKKEEKKEDSSSSSDTDETKSVTWPYRLSLRCPFVMSL